MNRNRSKRRYPCLVCGIFFLYLRLDLLEKSVIVLAQAMLLFLPVEWEIERESVPSSNAHESNDAVTFPLELPKKIPPSITELRAVIGKLESTSIRPSLKSSGNQEGKQGTIGEENERRSRTTYTQFAHR